MPDGLAMILTLSAPSRIFGRKKKIVFFGNFIATLVFMLEKIFFFFLVT